MTAPLYTPVAYFVNVSAITLFETPIEINMSLYAPVNLQVVDLNSVSVN
jgi:hypothetical protein